MPVIITTGIAASAAASGCRSGASPRAPGLEHERGEPNAERQTMDASLDKTYEPSRFESAWYPRWLEANAFAPQPRPLHGDPSPYVVLLPPPNVTGVLHMGHVLSTTLQDVFVRFHRMRGRETLWWPGTDHAGIATQKVVEKKLRDSGLSPRDMSREEIVAHCWKWKV